MCFEQKVPSNYDDWVAEVFNLPHKEDLVFLKPPSKSLFDGVAAEALQLRDEFNRNPFRSPILA